MEIVTKIFTNFILVWCGLMLLGAMSMMSILLIKFSKEYIWEGNLWK